MEKFKMIKTKIHIRYKSDYFKTERWLTYKDENTFPVQEPIQFFVNWIQEEDIVMFKLYKNGKLICRKSTY